MGCLVDLQRRKCRPDPQFPLSLSVTLILSPSLYPWSHLLRARRDITSPRMHMSGTSPPRARQLAPISLQTAERARH